MDRRANLSSTLTSLHRASDALVNAYKVLVILSSKVDVSRMNRSQGVQITGLSFAGDSNSPISGITGNAVSSNGTGYYQCRISFNPRSFRCTCPDSINRGGTKGPCKHVAALAQYALATLKSIGSVFEGKLSDAIEDLYKQLP